MKRVMPGDVGLHKRAVDELCQLIPSFDLSLPPPALAGDVYAMISRLCEIRDPFKDIKKEANEKVLSILPELKDLVLSSPHPLRTALHLSIIGNYIDAGVAESFDWEKALYHEGDDFLDAEIYPHFVREVEEGRRVMILGDNAGEIGLDTLLVEILNQMGTKVVYVVRERPVLNDATVEDAHQVGMDRLCEVISSGVDTPGTVLSRCSDYFLKRLAETPVVISKGQGNFEALKDRCNRPIFYAFKVKCKVVEGVTGLPLGSSVFALW